MSVLVEMVWSILKEFTIEADITSSGSAFHAFTTLILKKFTLCSMLFFSLGLYTFMLFPLVSAFSLNVKNCSQFTLSLPVIILYACIRFPLARLSSSVVKFKALSLSS